MTEEELPAGWTTASIGSLCKLKNGRAFKPTEWTTDGLPIVRIQNLNNAAAPFNHFNGEISDRYYLSGGELLFAWSGTPGTSFGAHIWRGGEAVLNQHIFRVDFDLDTLDKRFFRHAINQKLDELIDVAHGGVGLRHVTKGVFENTEISVPPLNEQKRIADKLDALLARVDACRERLDRVPALLKRFRQAVLAAATSGRLTEEWRGGKPAFWPQKVIGDLLIEKPRNGYSPRSVEYETPTRSLTLTATTSGRFKPEHFKYIDELIPANSHLWLQPDDILIQRANTREYVGISAIYDGPSAGFIYPDLMMKCRANTDTLPKYLHYVLLDEEVRTYFRENATGTAGNMPKINQQTVISAPVRLPSLSEQHEIVRRIEILLAFADRLEARVQAARAAVDRLMPSLLAKAFRGELVVQALIDISHTSQERHSESTSARSRVEYPIARARTDGRMNKLSDDIVREAIKQIAEERFSFDVLRAKLSADYESVKDAVFSILESEDSPIKQVFDIQSNAIRFEKIS